MQTNIKDVHDKKILHKDFFKVQCVIIQAILSRKSMKKFTVTDGKIFRVYKAFDRKIEQSYGFGNFPRTAFGERLSV